METTKFSLYNREISENYRNEKFYLMLSDFTGAMAYWLASNQHRAKIDIDKPLKAFSEYLQQKYFKTHDTIKEFDYEQLNTLISEDVFIAIPELLELNQIPSKDFYDLGALSRNVFYMICREKITQPSNLLKYRFKYLAKLDVEANYKNYSIGISCRYSG